MDEVLEIGFTRNQELLADTGEHLGAGGAELGLGDFEGELLTLAGANETELCSDLHNNVSGGRFGKCNVIHGVNIAHSNSLSTFHFSARHHYVFSVMRPKSKIDLLEELRDFVSDALTASHATRFGNVSEKRHNRKLKRLRKEVDKWIEELEKKDKLDETIVAA